MGAAYEGKIQKLLLETHRQAEVKKLLASNHINLSVINVPTDQSASCPSGTMKTPKEVFKAALSLRGSDPPARLVQATHCASSSESGHCLPLAVGQTGRCTCAGDRADLRPMGFEPGIDVWANIRRFVFHNQNSSIAFSLHTHPCLSYPERIVYRVYLLLNLKLLCRVYLPRLNIPT
jgi:hypothetical protein